MEYGRWTVGKSKRTFKSRVDRRFINVTRRRQMEKVKKKLVAVDVSIPGLGRLLNPNYGKMAKIIWFFIILICIVVCIGLTVNRFELYFSYPTATQSIVVGKEFVTFPSFSLCSSRMLNSLEPILLPAIERACKEQNKSCSDYYRITFKELNINWTEISQEFKLKNVYVKFPVTSMEGNEDDKPNDISYVDNLIGSCAVITHNQKVAYFSAATSLYVSIKEQIIGPGFSYTFIIHGTPANKLRATDVLTHEYEYSYTGFQTNVRILDQQIQLLNISGNECYDVDEEKERVNECAMKLLQPNICRLPSLPNSFRECETLKDISVSIDEIYKALNSNLRPSCPMRRICNNDAYLTSLDYVMPLSSDTDYMQQTDIVETSISIRFSDDLLHLTSENLVYLLPTLVSDLAAYWGFFLCFSALVCVEILEYFIMNIYHYMC